MNVVDLANAGFEEQRVDDNDCPYCRGKGEVWRRSYCEGQWCEPCEVCGGTGAREALERAR